jgi:hypothetical protein
MIGTWIVLDSASQAAPTMVLRDSSRAMSLMDNKCTCVVTFPVFTRFYLFLPLVDLVETTLPCDYEKLIGIGILESESRAAQDH